ncbi:hypothetical protein EYF80_024489 [Liparis tanakae]|uniref:Uncharacterized protein n=1 Tax=Liparis tanakae TaxID=230148 RepID=A0A4Z2HK95_9TELE|nr:hypothetical protein EYF80_024489 [Liparis tanakae]
MQCLPQEKTNAPTHPPQNHKNKSRIREATLQQLSSEERNHTKAVNNPGSRCHNTSHIASNQRLLRHTSITVAGMSDRSAKQPGPGVHWASEGSPPAHGCRNGNYVYFLYTAYGLSESFDISLHVASSPQPPKTTPASERWNQAEEPAGRASRPRPKLLQGVTVEYQSEKQQGSFAGVGPASLLFFPVVHLLPMLTVTQQGAKRLRSQIMDLNLIRLICSVFKNTREVPSHESEGCSWQEVSPELGLIGGQHRAQTAAPPGVSSHHTRRPNAADERERESLPRRPARPRANIPNRVNKSRQQQQYRLNSSSTDSRLNNSNTVVYSMPHHDHIYWIQMVPGIGVGGRVVDVGGWG